jgi:hypothetical protein
VDGDDTGTELETLLQSNCSEEELRSFSLKVNAAIRAVADAARQGPINGSIVFCEGDDLLSRGYWDTTAMRGLHELFRSVSGGRTCCIGFGKQYEKPNARSSLQRDHCQKVARWVFNPKVVVDCDGTVYTESIL